MKSAVVRASLGWLVRHPWQLGLALVGICIGVAVMVSVDLANESSRKAYRLSMDSLNGQSTHQVNGGPGGIDERVYVSLRRFSGVRNIAPVVAGFVSIGDDSLQLIGVDIFAEREFRSFTSPGDIGADIAGNVDTPGIDARELVKKFISGTGSVLLPDSVARRNGLTPGDRFEVIAGGKTFPAELVGSFDGGSQGLSNLVVTDIAVAQQWLAMTGRLSRIDVRLTDDDPAAVAAFAGRLPAGINLASADSRTQATLDMSDAFMTNLTAMSLLALLVGIFLIYNSVAFAVLQRRELLGILRAIGVTRAEVRRIVLSEAALLGSMGAGAGILAGVWLGEQLVGLVARTLSDHYFVVSVTSVSIDSLSLAKGFVAGVAATLVAAAIPAIEASNTPPRLAMTRSAVESGASAILPWLTLGGGALMLAACLVLAASGRSLVAGLFALFLLIFGFALCIPAFASALSAKLSPLAGRLGGIPGRLAIDGIARSLSRTGVAVVALAVAVSATIGVTVMVDSFRASVSDWIGTTLQSDVYVGVARGSLDPELLPDLVSVPGIEDFSTSRRAWLETAAGRTRIIALQMAPGSYAGTRLRGGDVDEAWRRFDEESAVLVSDAYAYRHGVGPGSTIDVPAAQGTATLDVAAVYQSYDSNDGAVLMSRASYDRLFDDDGIDSIGLYLAPGADAEAVMNDLREVSAGRQALMMTENARIRDISLAIFDRTFVITNVLYWLAVGVAVIGILGAMLALQLERAKEFGILRAIGMTPAQTGVLVTAQSGFIGLLAGLAAIPLGLVMAWMLIAVINRRAFGWQIDFVVDGSPLLTALLLSIGAALLAGLYPSWHAARTRPALAMREE